MNLYRVMIFVVIALMALPIFYTLTGNNVFAGSTDDGDTYGDNDDKKETCGRGTVWIDECFGATWRKYPIDPNDEANDRIVFSGKYYESTGDGIEGGVLEHCYQEKATYYYRLALEYYYTGTLKTTGKQVGLMKTSKVIDGNVPFKLGSLVAPTKDDDGHEHDGKRYSWEQVKGDYDAALALGYQFEHPFENLSAFCWNDDWAKAPETATATFSSESTVTVGSESETADSTSNPEATLEIYTDSDSVTVSFSHKVNYSGSSSSVSNGVKASTTHKVRGDELSSFGEQDNYDVMDGSNADSKIVSVSKPSITVNLSGVPEKTVCRLMSVTSATVEFKTGINPATPKGDTATSKVCAKIHHNTTTEEHQPESAGPAKVWSDTTMYVIGAQYNPYSSEGPVTVDDSAGNGTTDNTKVLRASVSPNQNQVLVGFEHNLHYQFNETNKPSNTSSSDQITGDGANIKYTITYNNNGSTSPSSEQTWNVKYIADSTEQKSRAQAAALQTVDVSHLGPGEEMFVCSTIEYKKRTYNWYRKEHTKMVPASQASLETAAQIAKSNILGGTQFASQDSSQNQFKLAVTWLNPDLGDWNTGGIPMTGPGSNDNGGSNNDQEEEEEEEVEVHDYWEYYVKNSSGKGRSQSCVILSRPAASDLSNNLDHGDVAFAEEPTQLSWSGTGYASLPHPLSDIKNFYFMLSADAPYGANKMKGTAAYPGSSDPCGYYNSSSMWSSKWLAGCSDAGSSSNNITYTYDYSRSQSITTPNYVGAKLCNAFAFKWGYRYAIRTASYSGRIISPYAVNFNSASWIPYGDSYWEISDLSCRTIAKKPSVAIWNGSFATSGSVDASLSPRNGTNYGSWVEHLGVIGGTAFSDGWSAASGLATGAMLAAGVSTANTQALSPLTISNAYSYNIGHSGVNLDADKYKERLDSYFEDTNVTTQSTTNLADLQPTSSRIPATIGCGSGVKVYRYNGDAKIDRDITAVGACPNIYQIPQVLIIATGNIYIMNDVKRLDAWLIAGGFVDTCGYTSATRTRIGTGTSAGDTNLICDRQLQINGPVIASHTKLERTYGAMNGYGYGYNSIATQKDNAAIDGDYRSAPAEIFNLPASTYLWAIGHANSFASSYVEASLRELAPRY